MATTDVVYDGQILSWGSFRWKASSGKLLNPAHAEKVVGESALVHDFQFKKYQNIRDRGPIPEGTYQIPLKDGGTTTTYKTRGGELTYDKDLEIQHMECIKAPSGQFVEFNHDWGMNRVRLKIVKFASSRSKHRSGFYIHDSIKGYSSGCIEVETGFFTELRKESTRQKGKGTLSLEVKYTHEETYGGTWIAGATLKERACSAP